MIDERYEYIGVLSAIDLLQVDIKRASVVFDKIAIPNIASETSGLSHLVRNSDPDMDFLLDQGVVIDPVQEYTGIEAYRKASGEAALPHLLREAEAHQLQLDKNLQYALTHPIEPASGLLIDQFIARLATKLNIFSARIGQQFQVPFTKAMLHGITFAQRLDYDRRRLACDLANHHNVSAFPLYTDETSFYKDYTGDKSDVLQLVLRAVPEPIFDSVPWEQILDFRNDPDTVRKRLAFRRWINGIVRKDLTPIEIHDELEDMCAQYKQHIQLHGLKAQTHPRKAWIRAGSTWILAGGAAAAADAVVPGSSALGAIAFGGFIGSLIKWLSDKGTDALFSLKESRVDLKLAEANAPGREVAYITCIRDKFSQ